MHLSHNAELVRNGIIGPIDFAIIEASAITEDGLIIPTNSVGNTPIYAQYADKILIELNTAQPDLEGIHDIYVPEKAGKGRRQPIPIVDPADRIGELGIRVDVDKIAGIVHSAKIRKHYENFQSYNSRDGILWYDNFRPGTGAEGL